MALRPGKVAIPFAGGIDTDTDAKQVAPIKLLDLQNAVFTKATTLVKRSGYRAYGSAIEAGGGDVANVKAIGARSDELILFTANGTYSRRPEADTWSLTGNPVSITARDSALVKTGTEQSSCDAATNGNVTVAAWVDSRGGIWWSVVEESTGRILRAASQLSTVGTQPRVVASGIFLHIYFADHAANVIWIAPVNINTPTLAVTPLQLTTDLTPLNVGYDVCPTTYGIDGGTANSPDTPTAIVWPSNVNTIRTAYVDPTGVLGSPLTSLPSVASVAVGAFSSNVNVGIAYSGTSGVGWSFSNNVGAFTDVARYDIDLATLDIITFSTPFSPTPSLRTHACVWVGPTLYVAIDDTEGAASERDSRIQLLTFTPPSTAVAVGAPFPIRGLSLASRAFLDNGIPYVFAVHEVPFFSVYLLIRLTDAAVVARMLPIIAHGVQDNGASTWTSSVTVDPTNSRRWRAPLLYNEQLEGLAGQFAETGIRWVGIDFDDSAAWQSQQLGAGLYLAGALPQHYDGDRWAEAGWHYAPDGTITATPSVGGGALVDGTYTYQVWYEEIDGQGEVHRGPTSVGTIITLLAQDTVTLTGPMYRATSRRRVRVCIARTEADGTELFRVTSLDPSATGPNGYILNDPTVDTWTFVDQMSDATLLTMDPLYTTGGILSNDPAPMAGGVLSVGKNRLFFTDPSDPTMVRYTQELEEGFAADFAAPLKLRQDPFGGAVIAIAILDDTVVPLRESAIYKFGGPGPLPNPTDDPATFTFTPSALVTSDVGCVDTRSVANTPIGFTFKSAKGIRLLGRDLKVIDIGSEVRAFDGQDVSAATLYPTEPRILFLTSSGSTLQYDYLRGQWSRFTNHAGIDAIVHGGLYHYLRADGRVFVETPGEYRDDNSHIPMVLEMAWLKMAGYLQGWQRVWYAQFLGEWKSSHTLRVRYRVNYEQQWSAPFDLDVDNNFTATPYGGGPYGGGPYGSTGSSVYQRRIHINRDCQSIQFQLQDVELTDVFGAAFELSELVITGGLKGPLYKLEATRSS